MLQYLKKFITFMFIFCVILFTLSSLTYSQKRSIKILGVSVQGNITTDADIIKMTAGLLEGKEITGDQIQKSIKQLWGLNIFSDIQLYLITCPDLSDSRGVSIQQFMAPVSNDSRHTFDILLYSTIFRP